MDEDTRKTIKNLRENVSSLGRNQRFIMQMDRRSLMILARMAYVLERLSNRVLGVEDAEVFTEVESEKAFREIRRLFEEQREIMREEDESRG
ncbi:MAG: hypothetical protein ACFCUT_17560 [Kiloniellaceae bacterium]